MMSNGVADSLSIARDNVYYASRDTSLFDELANTNCSKRRKLGWFNDDGVTSCQCWKRRWLSLGRSVCTDTYRVQFSL